MIEKPLRPKQEVFLSIHDGLEKFPTIVGGWKYDHTAMQAVKGVMGIIHCTIEKICTRSMEALPHPVYT